MLLLSGCLILCHLWHGFGEESLKKIVEGINDSCTLLNSSHMTFVTLFCLWPQGQGHTTMYARVHHLDVEQLVMWALKMKYVTYRGALWTSTVYDELVSVSSITLNIKTIIIPTALRKQEGKLRVYDCFLNGRRYSWTLFHQPFLTEYAFNSQF